MVYEINPMGYFSQRFFQLLIIILSPNALQRSGWRSSCVPWSWVMSSACQRGSASQPADGGTYSHWKKSHLLIASRPQGLARELLLHLDEFISEPDHFCDGQLRERRAPERSTA